jgi:phosphatidylserine/phosphatidylglycerophosphate/cardiolipin synthase-like enzyme
MKKLIICFLSLAASSTFAAQPFGNDAAYDVGFSPQAGALQVVLGGIKSARSSILVAAYTFTSKPIAYALIDAQKRGVKVYVVADEAQNSKSYSAVNFLANHGVPVSLDNHYQDMHNKYLVIDGLHVETGSFNFSMSADSKNSENALLLWNVPALAASYTNQWRKLWAESKPIAARY